MDQSRHVMEGRNRPGDELASHHHISALDGLRALAVIIVILRHVGSSHFYGGFLGVDLFFVLSGFLITRLLLQEFAESRSIRLDLFYERRACRLLPAISVLLFVVIVCREAMPVTFSCPLSWWFSSLAVLLFFANFTVQDMGALGHTWSLSVEEQFYFLWPVTLLFVLRRFQSIYWRISITLALALSGAGLRAYLQSVGGMGIDVYTFLFTRMDSLLLGALMAFAENLPNITRICSYLTRLRISEVVVVALCVTVFLFRESAMPFMNNGGYTITSFLFGILILTIANEPRETMLKRVLQSRLAVWLGKRSYGTYLYHLPVISALSAIHISHGPTAMNMGYLTLSFAISISLADLSYRYVELPFLRRKVLLKWNMVRG